MNDMNRAHFCVVFFFSAIKIVKITFGQTRDTHSCEKLYLCKVRTLNVSSLEKYNPDTNFALFIPGTLELPK